MPCTEVGIGRACSVVRGEHHAVMLEDFAGVGDKLGGDVSDDTPGGVAEDDQGAPLRVVKDEAEGVLGSTGPGGEFLEVGVAEGGLRERGRDGFPLEFRLETALLLVAVLVVIEGSGISWGRASASADLCDSPCSGSVASCPYTSRRASLSRGWPFSARWSAKSLISWTILLR